MYAARAAGVLSAVEVLTALGADAHHNVREAALAALIDLKRPEAVPAALSALTLDDHQLVLTATRAFTDASTAPKAVPALLTALGRLTKAHSDTSRDPRMAILERLQALGDRSQATALEGYLKDYDPRVAQKAADILAAWTGTPRTIAPSPLPPPGITLAAIEELRGRRLRVTMEGRGSFEIGLDVDFAPLAVAAHRASRRRRLLQRPDVPPRGAELRDPGRQPRRQRVCRRRPATCATRSASIAAPPWASRRAAATPATPRSSSTSWTRHASTTSTPCSARSSPGMEVVDAILEGDVITRIELVAP